MVFAAIMWFGVFLSVSWYGWVHLLVFFPVWYFFGHFWGVAPLVGMIRVANCFTTIEFCLTLVFQFCSIIALWFILSWFGMTALYSYFLFVGLVVGFSMNANDLRTERNEFTATRKPYFWESRNK